MGEQEPRDSLHSPTFQANTRDLYESNAVRASVHSSSDASQKAGTVSTDQQQWDGTYENFELGGAWISIAHPIYIFGTDYQELASGQVEVSGSSLVTNNFRFELDESGNLRMTSPRTAVWMKKTVKPLNSNAAVFVPGHSSAIVENDDLHKDAETMSLKCDSSPSAVCTEMEEQDKPRSKKYWRRGRNRARARRQALEQQNSNDGNEDCDDQ